MIFDAKTVKAARIKEDAEYEGVRITLTAALGTARLPLQVDVGFGDAVTPEPVEVEFPTLLPMTAPKLRAYRRRDRRSRSSTRWSTSAWRTAA